MVPPPISDYSLSTTYGFHVFVHNKSNPPEFDAGFHVAVGAETNVAFTRTFSNRLSSPYSDCVSQKDIEQTDSVFINAFKLYNHTYTQKRCFSYCYQRRLVYVCKCSDLSIPYFQSNSKKGCTTYENVGCLFEVYSQFYKYEVVANCSDECPIECQSISYSYSLSSYNYPSRFFARALYKQNQYLRSLVGNVTDENEQYNIIKNSVLSFRIFYENMAYTLIQESPNYTIVISC